MADGATEPAQERVRMVSPTALLGTLASLLALTFVVLLGVHTFGGSAAAEPHTGSDQGVRNTVTEDNPQEVARQAALAFLDVDYREMAPRVQRVLSLATGSFYDEYEAAEATLTAAAKQGEVVSTGVVRHVGLGEITQTSARVLVAADSTVSNTLIAESKAAGLAVDDTRTYRMQVELTQVDGSWLVNDLRFVS